MENNTEQLHEDMQDLLKEPILNIEEVAKLITPRLDEIDEKIASIKDMTETTVRTFLTDLKAEAEKQAQVIKDIRWKKIKNFFKIGGTHSLSGSLITILYEILIRK